jgi:bacterioferritin-associated ferredoxin
MRGCLLCAELGRPKVLAMFVCHCRAVTDGEIREAISAGACDLDEVGRYCGAGITCGGCCPLIQELLAEHAPAPPAPLLEATSR